MILESNLHAFTLNFFQCYLTLERQVVIFDLLQFLFVILHHLLFNFIFSLTYEFF